MPLTQISELSLLSGMALGLASALHCAAMCGGIASGVVFFFEPEDTAGRARVLLFAQAGRVTSYGLAGAVLGFAGSGLYGAFDHETAYRGMQWAGAVALMWIGLSIAGLLPPLTMLDRRIAALSGTIGRALGPLRSRRVSGPFVSGLTWGIVPCPIVYGALFVALLTGSAGGGLALMAGFGIGTLPAVTATALGVTALANIEAKGAARAGVGLLIAGLGLMTLYSGHLAASAPCAGRRHSPAQIGGPTLATEHAVDRGDGMGWLGRRGGVGDPAEIATQGLAGLEGGRLAAILSGVALAFSGYSLWETSLKHADVRVFVPPVIQYSAPYQNSNFEMIAIPVTLTNEGARTGTVLSMELAVTDPRGNATKRFYAADFGRWTMERTRSGAYEPFAPISLAGRESRALSVLFYTRGEEEKPAQLIRDTGPYNFELTLEQAESGGLGLAPGAAPKVAFARELRFYDARAFNNGTLPMYSSDWRTSSNARAN